MSIKYLLLILSGIERIKESEKNRDAYLKFKI